MTTLEEWIRNQQEWAQGHLAVWIFGLFAGLALGLYSVVSYSVAQRISEFGIRLALGAKRSHVIRIVLASTAWSVGTGIAAGVGLTLALRRALGGFSEESAASVAMLSGAVGCWRLPRWRHAWVQRCGRHGLIRRRHCVASETTREPRH